MEGLWKTKLGGELKESKRRKNSIKHFLKDKKNFLQKEIFKIEYRLHKDPVVVNKIEEDLFYKNLKLDRKMFRKCKHFYELGGERFVEWIDRSKVKTFLKKKKFDFDNKKSFFVYY